MNILVIGGSYFLGKAFVKAASDGHDITVLNRGTKPLCMENVHELVCDRKNEAELKQIFSDSDSCYDIVVDFCAYEAGDIKSILETVNKPPKQYIFISTVDVYRRGMDEWCSEAAPLEVREFPGEAGTYISGKVALERELMLQCDKRGIAYTSLRPAFLFGPENYAPREQMYFLWAAKSGQIIHPSDADGVFQMVYVQDMVRAIILVLANENAYNQAFNICSNQLISYASFADCLEKVTGRKLTRAELSVRDVIERNIPLPFPLTLEESNRYDGNKIEKLGMKYSDFLSSLREAYLWWCSKHIQN